jgi:phenylalanyl-tRNA synthetase beta chain
MFRMLNLEVKLEEPKENPSHFIVGRVAEILFKNKKIGFLGEIHPKILRNWKIRMPVALLEMDFDELTN